MTYELNVDNTGNLDAEEAEVWDVLPTGIKCADVTLPAQTAPRPPHAPKGPSSGPASRSRKARTTTLTYEVKVPNDVAPGHTFINQAGVTQLQIADQHRRKNSNTSRRKTSIRTLKEAESNTGPLLAEARNENHRRDARKDGDHRDHPAWQPGHEATIGEMVDYTVTAKIPANSQIYGPPMLRDELPTNLECSKDATQPSRRRGAAREGRDA